MELGLITDDDNDDDDDDFSLAVGTDRGVRSVPGEHFRRQVHASHGGGLDDCSHHHPGRSQGTSTRPAHDSTCLLGNQP